MNPQVVENIGQELTNFFSLFKSNMQGDKMQDYLKAVLANMPMDWLNLTTHRLDIYEEKLAKVQFLDRVEQINKT